MPWKEFNFDAVREFALTLPGVEENTSYGAPSWKLHGKLLVCPAIHKSAEPNSLAVKIAPAERDRLMTAEPARYYLTDHYENSSVVLVRLPLMDASSLHQLIYDAWRFVSDS